MPAGDCAGELNHAGLRGPQSTKAGKSRCSLATRLLVVRTATLANGSQRA